MSTLQQNIVIAFIVIAALAYLGWTFSRSFLGKKNCGCGGTKCPKMEDALKSLEARGRGNQARSTAKGDSPVQAHNPR